MAVAAFALWWNSLPVPVDLKNKEILPAEKIGETTKIYGVEMQNECFNKFQDFIKNYGADYNKCLVDFDFNEQYCGGFDPNTEGLSDINIIVVLDSSGSMAENIGFESKINIAKRAISEFLAKIPPGVKIGLVVYGHKGSNATADKSLSCSGIEEIVKLGGNNGSKIISAMNSFSPKGWTPIAGSLNFVKDIFASKEETNKNYLILVSDGVESCDGNPLTAAENLKIAIPDIKLNVIGFSADKETYDFLGKIATRGGGTYLTANSSADMVKAFNDELFLIKKDCVSVTFLQMALRYQANNVNNLNCWLEVSKKESDDFSINMSHKIIDQECNLEMANALKGRQNESWSKKETLAEKNSVIYNQIELDLNKQLNILNGVKN